jgi:outer membrane protein assembly factor BamE (lipoprotein component of BamABCDE complex)
MSLPQGSRAFLIAVIGGAALLAGCVPYRDHHGFMLDEQLASAIQPGVDNRDSVQGTLGRPTFIGQFDQRDWYYVSRDTRELAFAMPRPTQQTVLHVRFDEQGNVQSVNRTGLDLAVRITPDRDKTPTPGTHRNFLEELFGNIGAVGSAAQGGQTADNPQ